MEKWKTVNTGKNFMEFIDQIKILGRKDTTPCAICVHHEGTYDDADFCRMEDSSFHESNCFLGMSSSYADANKHGNCPYFKSNESDE